MNTEQLDKPHVDLETLSALRDVMESDYPLLIDTFLEDSQARVLELRRAPDAEALSHAAHSFKGSSSNMGAVHLAQLCHDLEQQAMHSQPSESETIISLIESEFLTVRELYILERARFLG